MTHHKKPQSGHLYTPILSRYSKLKVLFIPIFLIATILLTHCTNGKAPADTPTIDFAKTSKDSINHLLDCSILEMETTNISILGWIGQIEITDDYIFILDNYQTNKLNAYDKNGRFIQQVGSNGKGPGEYILPWSFSINKEKNLLSVIDLDTDNLLSYDLNSLCFLNQKHIPFSTKKMEYLPNGMLAWHEIYSDYFIYITDSLLAVKHEYIKKEFNPELKYGFTRKLYSSSSGISFFTPFSPAIYEINEAHAKMRYNLKFGDKKFVPVDFLKKAGEKSDRYIKEMKSTNYVNYYHVFETDSFLYVPFTVKEEKYIGFFDKNKRKSYRFKEKDIIEQLKLPSCYSPVGCLNNWLIVKINIVDVLDKIKNGDLFNQKINSRIQKLSESNNLIFLLIKLKKG